MTGVFKLGLTGGIGSGKSTVASMLAQQGATIIDADHISRSVTAAGGAAIAPIASTFGPEAIDAQGAMNRSFMRQRVFADPAARQQLEGIIHPLVQQLTAQHTQQAIADGSRWLVFDVPLLVESSHWRKKVDAVLVVDCEEATQIARTMARSQLDPAAVQAIITSQASRAERRDAADWVIYNEGLDFAQLRQEVLSISALMPL